MQYRILYKPKASKDLKGISSSDRERILDAVDALSENLLGDVKKLVNFTPEYRLRVGIIASCLRLKGTVSLCIRFYTEAKLTKFVEKELSVSALHPEFLSRNGKKLFAVIPYEAFVALQERLEDADDLLELRKAKLAEGNAPTISSDEMRSILNCPRRKTSAKRGLKRAKSKYSVPHTELTPGE